jgi:hypothetical protein
METTMTSAIVNAKDTAMPVAERHASAIQESEGAT